MTELEKLKSAAGVIYDMTEGRIQMRPSGLGHVCIHAQDNAYLTLDMEMRSNYEKQCYDITFHSHVRRMGSDMNSRDLGLLYKEVHQTQALLTALELAQFQPTLEDLQDLHDHLEQQEQVRNQQMLEVQSM